MAAISISCGQIRKKRHCNDVSPKRFDHAFNVTLLGGDGVCGWRGNTHGANRNRPAEGRRPVCPAGRLGRSHYAGRRTEPAPHQAGFLSQRAAAGAGFRRPGEDGRDQDRHQFVAFHADKKLAAGTNIALVSIPIYTWNIKRADLVRALAEIEVARKKGPVLLHCQHGADRTGIVSALYRMLYEGWSREAALDEMRNGKFGYHAVWGNIPRFIEKVDVDALRKDVAAQVCGFEGGSQSGAVCKKG